MQDDCRFLPLSSVQREIWLDQSLAPEAPIYNLGGYNCIEGDFDPEILRHAIWQLVQETDILRLQLHPQEDMPLQSFPEMPVVNVRFFDCQHETDPMAAALVSMQSDARQPFKLFEEPLFRYTLYRLAEKTFIWAHVHHHLIIDGWAFSLVLQRVVALYHALLNGEVLPPAPGVSYAEFVASDATYLKSTHFERDQKYWQQQFTHLPEPLFAVRNAYLGRQDIVEGPSHFTFLDRARYNQLEALAEAHSATIFHALIGLFCLYFARFCDRDECVIGVPVFNRNTAAFKQTIGLFASVIPVRFAIDWEANFTTLMQFVGKVLRERYRHQRFPISEINWQSGLFATGRKSLFDITLSFDRHKQHTQIGDNPIATIKLADGFEQAPLSLYVLDYFSTQGIQFEFSFNLAYFAPEDIERVSKGFLHLVDEVLAHSDLAIGALDILPPEERHLLLEKWNATAAPLPKALVHQLFETQAARTPDIPALVFAGETLSYAELNERANQLAHALIDFGIEPDARVAIALERSPTMIVALLATLKAGGAFVPLDPEYPAERLAFMLEDSGAKVLLTSTSFANANWILSQARNDGGSANAFDLTILCLDTDYTTFTAQPKTNPNQSVSPHHLAYVIYTSGSTGKPKGVMVEHRGLPNLALAQSDAFDIKLQSHVLQFASFSFDAAVSEIFMALCSGAALYLPNAEQRLPGLPLWQHLAENAITHVTLPPPALAVLPQDPLPKLESLIVAGEPCPPALAAFWAKNRRFFNAYGPTETSVCASIAECLEIDLTNALPIGRPIANTRLFVLDRNLQPVPLGVAGELCIGGVGLARGYLNRPELTAEKFISDPFGNEPDARLYRTGDLARYHPDGNLEFLGRIDQQVKIRGFRIELGEIENALIAHPDVREAVVIAKTEETGELRGDKRLIAHLVLHSKVGPTSRELLVFLKASLPDYMLPAAWVFHVALPLTPNGKVDRKALLASETITHSQKPQDALDEIIAGFWSKLLEHTNPGIHDNFFELGGHSLIATRLASRLSSALGIAVPMRWIFEAPTIATLAERIRSGWADGKPTSEITDLHIPTVSRNQPLPLSFAQQRLWFLDQFEGPSAIYNMPGRLELVGTLDQQALAHALTEIVRRHEVLRTCLVKRNDEPFQYIFPAEPLCLPCHDLSACDDPEAEACRLADEEALLPFDLAADLPLRVRLLQRQESAWTLLITLHHSAADGWSVGVLLNELTTLYTAFHAGQPSPLPGLSIQYADFAAWQRRWFSGERRKQQLDYWCCRLAGAPERLNLPTDRPLPPRQSYRGNSITFMIDADLAAAANDFSRRSGATLFMTLLAVWASLLSRYSGEDDLVVGSPMANRNVSAIEPLIGFFVNTLALRVDLSGYPSFNEVLARIRRICLEAYAHQDIPFESLVEALEIPRRLDHAPLFQVMFVLQNDEIQHEFQLPGLQATLHENEGFVAKFDLTLSICENANGFKAVLEYATDLFEQKSIEGMAQHYVEFLRSALSQPDQPITEQEGPHPSAPSKALEAKSKEPLSLPQVKYSNSVLQELVAGLWNSLLHQYPSLHDNFFELGGHSLLATRITSRLNDALGISVPVRWIFEYPTVASLVERIHIAMSGEHQADPVPSNRIKAGNERITPDLLPLITLTQGEIDVIVATVDGGASNVKDIYPLTPLQQGILFHHQLQSVGDAYLSYALLAFDSCPRLDGFLAAFQSVIDRHDILRSAVVWEGLSQPAQIVWRQARLPIDIYTFDPAQGPMADQLIASCHPEHNRLDLTTAPLMRIALTEDRGRWLMLFISHHLIMDHASLDILLKEIMACQQGEFESLSLTLPFRNYVYAAQQGLSHREHEVFFRDMLSDIEEPTAPFGLLDVQRDGSNIKEASRTLSPELAQRLRSAVQRLGSTPAALCHLAWALVLARCCNQKNVVFGTVLLGRMQGGEGIEHAIGLFINALPIRITCDQRPVVESLRQTQQVLLKLMRHEHAPLGLALQCSAVLPPSPLFSSLLNYRHSPGGMAPVLEGITLLKAEEHTNYPLGLSVDDLGEGFALTAQVDSSLDPDRICAYMQHALEGLVLALDEAPLKPLCQIDTLSSEERQLLLVDWNTTATTIPELCVHQLFEAQAESLPEAAALVFEGQTLTYAGLNGRANQLAHHLIECGVGPDDRVAIALERSPNMIVALLAVLKSGGAYVPLDPDYPLERLSFMLEDSGARFLITHESLKERFVQGGTLPTLCLDSAKPLLSTQSQTNPNRLVAAHHLAYVIYTSGSTGKPKGVAVEHRGLGNLAQAQILSFGLTPQSRVLQFASFSFDAAVSEIMMALCSGAALYLPNAEERLPGPALNAYLVACVITHLTLPPTALAALPQMALPALTSLIIAGEPCPPVLARLWSKNRRFFNAYGPTEASVCASIAECTHTDLDSDKPLSIGRPLANTQLYLLDGNQRLVPVGVPGELYIGGTGIARGYLNRPELTAERFISNPFATVQGERLYRTGDLVRYRADGNIEFLGRLDHQVKIRGFRVELGEIETALVNHPTIREAVVVARSDESRGFENTRLVAYVVSSASESAPNSGELRTFLKAILPDYMLPSAFVSLDALPLTPNGKIDRQALPEPKSKVSTESLTLPRDALEEIMVGLWATVLHHETVGIHSNFFELGGHSLLAMQLASRLREALGITVPVRWVFEAPTVAELAGRIRNNEQNDESSVSIPPNRIQSGTTHITPDLLPLIALTQTEIDQIVDSVEGGASNIQDIYPLVPLQQDILLHHLLPNKGDAYLSHALLAFDSRDCIDAFIAAFQSAIDRHDILRSSVIWEQLPEPVQVVWRQAKLPIDIRHFDPDRGPVADQLIESCHPDHTRLDLTRAPLLRLVMAEDKDRWLLQFFSHHMIVDNTTFEVLLEEIEAHINGKQAFLSPSVPFRNFVAQTRNSISTQEHETFFRDMLGQIETPTAPFGLLDTQGDGSRMLEARRTLPPDLAQRLRNQTRRLGATPAALHHLAWALVLSRCCNQAQVVFGTVLFGRLQGGDGVERAMGMFINILPLCITCDDRPVAEALKKTQQDLLKLMRHEHATLSLAQRCSAILAPTPLFSALLNYRHSPLRKNADTILTGIEILQAKERTNYPFDMTVDDLGEGFALTARVDSSLDPDQICDCMQRALEGLVSALEKAPPQARALAEILENISLSRVA